MTVLTVPIIDLAPAWKAAEPSRRRVAWKIGEACRDISRVRARNYPVPPALAMRLRRPVKWVEQRRENFLAMTHGRDHIQEAEIVGQRDGTISVSASPRGPTWAPTSRCSRRPWAAPDGLADGLCNPQGRPDAGLRDRARSRSRP